MMDNEGGVNMEMCLESLKGRSLFIMLKPCSLFWTYQLEKNFLYNKCMLLF